LYHQGYRFDFFQAVRILERYFEHLAKENPKLARAPVGFDSQPDREIVRFRSLPSMSFPGNAITEIRRAKELDYIAPEDRPPAEMIVAFLGLTGPQGVLPRHYTALLMKRLQEKDPTLREFFDLFNHRTISLFYRAWEKYRFPLAAERRARSTTSFGEDLFSQALFCYVGMGTQGQQDRLEIPNDAFLFYSGLFATERRSAQPLETLLGDYFQLPVSIEQFQGQWLYLDEEDLSRMPDRRHRQGVNVILGRGWTSFTGGISAFLPATFGELGG
jgi:type VI secretion system protein ImpH